MDDSSPANRQPPAANLVAAALFVALAILMTWPLIRNLGRAVSDPGDPLLTAWILDWDWWATFHQPLSLFQANAFFPSQYSLAYTENLYGIALLLFPVRALGVGPVAAQNLSLLAGFAFCGFGAFLLGRKLTGSFAAGLAAGIFYAFLPYRFVHLSHIQLIWGGWLPLLLLALLRYAERPSWKRGIVFGAVFLMNGLTNIHFLLFGAFVSAVTALLLIPRRAWRELAVPLFVALLLLAPFLYPYLVVAKLYGMQRGAEEVLRFSAVPRDWLPGGATEPERMLAPGGLALGIAAAAFVVARREKAKLALASLWIAVGFAGSLGLHFLFHEFLFGAVPGFRALRVPARWAVIAYIGLAILIALTTAAMGRRRRWLGWMVPVALLAAVWRGPVRWFLLDPEPPAVDRWLAMQHVSAIAELPMDTSTSEYESMLHATTHRQRMVNGISGFSPPLREELSRLSNATPIPDAFVDALRTAGVELVIVRSDWYGARSPVMREWLRRELDRGRLRYVRHFDAQVQADWVFSLRGGAGTRSRDLEVFLAGAATCTSSIAGVLERPGGGATLRGPAEFRGWASSPDGIATVDLWMNNRQIRHRALLRTLPPERCPGSPPVRFALAFPTRPAEVWRQTDVQVEVTDRKGRTKVFADRWIGWE